MNRKIYLIYLFLFLQVVGLSAQKVIISGNAKTYAGDVLQWKTYTDQITFTEKILAESKVDKNGNFKFEISINETKISFINLSVFKGILYIEPNKNYQIVLPQKVKKTKADELNPFFEPSVFFVRCINPPKNDLNLKIKKFDALLDKYMAALFKQFKGKIEKPVVDSIVGLIENEVPEDNDKYFADYKKYHYAAYRLLAYERNKEKFIKEYFTHNKILFNNPAYMDLFNRVFNNYLKHLYRKPEGKYIPYNLIKLKSLTRLKANLDSFPYLQNDTLKDLIILKSLYDNFYKDDFPQKSILFMIDSVKQATDVDEIAEISENITKKLTTLFLGYPAPDFLLMNSKGKMMSLNDFKGSFVYLNFCTPQSYSCQKDFKLLKQLYLQKHELLKIVTICVCDSYSNMEKLMKENKYKWTFLYYNKNNELLQKYNVRVYPSYYMINPEGKLVMLPAFPPEAASFEARYYNTLKSWKRELIRRKQEKTKQQSLGNY